MHDYSYECLLNLFRSATQVFSIRTIATLLLSINFGSVVLAQVSVDASPRLPIDGDNAPNVEICLHTACTPDPLAERMGQEFPSLATIQCEIYIDHPDCVRDDVVKQPLTLPTHYVCLDGTYSTRKSDCYPGKIECPDGTWIDPYDENQSCVEEAYCSDGRPVKRPIDCFDVIITEDDSTNEIIMDYGSCIYAGIPYANGSDRNGQVCIDGGWQGRENEQEEVAPPPAEEEEVNSSKNETSSTEPRRVCRRLICLSYAAMSDLCRAA